MERMSHNEAASQSPSKSMSQVTCIAWIKIRPVVTNLSCGLTSERSRWMLVLDVPWYLEVPCIVCAHGFVPYLE